VILIVAAFCVTVPSTHMEAQASSSECQTWTAKTDPTVEGKTAINAGTIMVSSIPRVRLITHMRHTGYGSSD